MKISLAYPKIPDSKNCPLKKCVAFEKLDGTCIWFLWKKDSFESFGTRRDMFYCGDIGRAKFKIEHPELSPISDMCLFSNSNFFVNLSEQLVSKAKYINATRVILFFEYFGKNSFAGIHQPTDDKKLWLIDSQIDERMLGPEEFMEDFAELEHYTPKIIYSGKYSGQLIEDIRHGKYNVDEGAVIKGMYKDKVYMVKVKTDQYLEKLKTKFKDNWKDYWE